MIKIMLPLNIIACSLPCSADGTSDSTLTGVAMGMSSSCVVSFPLAGGSITTLFFSITLKQSMHKHVYIIHTRLYLQSHLSPFSDMYLHTNNKTMTCT